MSKSTDEILRVYFEPQQSRMTFQFEYQSNQIFFVL